MAPQKHLPGPDPRGTNSRGLMQTFRSGRVGRISMSRETEEVRAAEVRKGEDRHTDVRLAEARLTRGSPRVSPG